MPGFSSCARLVYLGSLPLAGLLALSPRSTRSSVLAATATQLEETEHRFHLLIDAVTDYAIFMLDTAGNVVTWHPGAERINGYSSGEIIGQHFQTKFYYE
jgi:PAS domain-containing protein